MTLFLPWHKVVVKYKMDGGGRFTITFFDDRKDAEYSDMVTAAVERAKQMMAKEEIKGHITGIDVSAFRE